MSDKSPTYYQYEFLKTEVERLKKDLKALIQCANFYAGDELFADLIKRKPNFGFLAKNTLRDLANVPINSIELETIDELRYRLVMERLDVYNGNKTRTAKSLDIHVKTLESYMKGKSE